MPKVKMVCTTCGSDDVVRDAWAAWDKDTQAWELHSIYDNAFCNTCSGETTIEEEVL